MPRKQSLSRSMDRIGGLIHSTLDFDEIMQRVISEAAQAVGSETVVVSLRQGDHWVVRYVHGFSQDVIGTRMDDRQEPHAVLAIETRKPVVIDDSFTDERVNRAAHEEMGRPLRPGRAPADGRRGRRRAFLQPAQSRYAVHRVSRRLCQPARLVRLVGGPQRPPCPETPGGAGRAREGRAGFAGGKRKPRSRAGQPHSASVPRRDGRRPFRQGPADRPGRHGQSPRGLRLYRRERRSGLPQHVEAAGAVRSGEPVHPVPAGPMEGTLEPSAADAEDALYERAAPRASRPRPDPQQPGGADCVPGPGDRPAQPGEQRGRLHTGRHRADRGHRRPRGAGPLCLDAEPTAGEGAPGGRSGPARIGEEIQDDLRWQYGRPADCRGGKQEDSSWAIERSAGCWVTEPEEIASLRVEDIHRPEDLPFVLEHFEKLGAGKKAPGRRSR